MNYEKYAAFCTGTLAGVIAGAAFVMAGDVIGAMFAGICFFVLGTAAFIKTAEGIEQYKAIQAWERHRAKNVDFNIKRLVPGSDDYIEL